MSLLPVGIGSSGGYEIDNSLRFRRSAGAYISRTFPSAGNTTTWTWKGSIRRGVLGTRQMFLSSSIDPDANSNFFVEFDASDRLSFYTPVLNLFCVTSPVFRDPSGHYEIQFCANTGNATAADRFRVYVNGVRITSFATSPSLSLNYALALNQAKRHVIGEYSYTLGAGFAFDGYLSEIHFIDGQALDPTSFGEFDAVTGVWVPKEYTGTYGTNGFYLPFNDGTNLTNLCLDRSGNGNNWTATNISLTAGATYDWMDDTPTNNFAVSNVLDIDRTNITTSNGNLTLTKATAGDSPRAASTVGVTSGKWYAELTWATMSSDAVYADYFVTGVTTKEDWITTSNGYNSVNYYASDAAGGLNGNKATWSGGSFSGSSAYGTGYYVNGSVIGIALDLDAGTVTFYNNGVSQGAITLPTTSQPWFFYSSSDGTNNSYTAHWNFGQRPFAYTPPTGFKALCTKNLPAPTIVNPQQHFDVVLDTGANIKTTAEALYTDQLVWIKDRANTNNHQLIDSVRGTSAVLQSNTTAAETTYSAPSGSSVAWVWKANGTGVSNTAGSITSTVSANTTAGFSIVTYTGTGANATVGHGLGVAPKMIITKRRTGAAVSWGVYHASIGASNALYLDLTNASAASTNWNGTPTSAVFGIGTAGESNLVSQSYVAYCFAEVPGFSKIGSYTGNGNADGPFVYCGFKPAFVMVKRTDTTSNWFVVDAARGPSNLPVGRLLPNLSNAEDTASTDEPDFLSNGFKFRGSGAGANTSGGTYIFLAFADAPFKYSNAR